MGSVMVEMEGTKMVLAVSDDGMVVELRSDGTWAVASTVSTASGDFRGLSWGSSVADVRARERRDAKLEGQDVLVFPERVSDMEADAAYIFVAGRLTRAKYIFTEKFTSPNRYLVAYQQVKTLFSGKYGEPDEDLPVWHDNHYRDDPDGWGLAVERGDLTFFTSWTTTRTEISLILHGNDYESQLSVEYTSSALKAWAESVQLEAEHDLI
ncbi:hypothetical protein [Microbacterium sp. C7(2022)]|uniref:hypothetical protein n=1 Tax=Microbacterium sp. C7(2022) TaxID=2992759 RepID=UPI00237B2D94|nr:hypothetical protein [Microbacterium sp. C7(2022)]MDE0546351.1 hypothetical protein [Microbacterium sp. C7(2022)]